MKNNLSFGLIILILKLEELDYQPDLLRFFFWGFGAYE